MFFYCSDGCVIVLTFGGDTSTDLDIWLLNDKTTLNGTAACAAKFRRDHPLVVCIRQRVDRDNADTIAVVTAFARSEADTPLCLAGLGKYVMILDVFHRRLCCNGITASAHFDKGVALVFVCNTRLDLAEATEDGAELLFTSCSATNEQRPAEHLDVTRWESRVDIGPLRGQALHGNTGAVLMTVSGGARRRALAVCTSANFTLLVEA